MPKFTYIDLFAGCGGLSEGFSNSNLFEGLAHVEWEVPMVDTLRNRLVTKWNYSKDQATDTVIHFDIQKTEELIHGNWTHETNNIYGQTNSDLVKKLGLKGIIQD